MHLWIVFILAGEIIGAQGPLEGFLNDDTCADLIAEYRVVVDNSPGGLNPNLIPPFKGRKVTASDLRFECKWADDLPTTKDTPHG